MCYPPCMTIEIVTIRLEHAAPIEALQLICFPDVPPEELFSVQDVVGFCETFPDGTFVALDGERVVGLGSGLYAHYDLERPATHKQVLKQGHDPAAPWYFGTDISVHPDYRKQGIGKRLYDKRKEVVQRDNKRGIVAGGFIPNYVNHKQTMSIETYIQRVSTGDLFDPTLSFQLKNGFTVEGVIPNYMTLDNSDNYATLVVWRNPTFSG